MTFKDIFPGLSKTLSFNFQDFPGPKWFSRTFQVLEFSRKKSRTFQEAWEPCWHQPYICSSSSNNSITPWRYSYSGVEQTVVKYGSQGQSGQAIKLFQITPYVNDFPDIQQSRLLTAW